MGAVPFEYLGYGRVFIEKVDSGEKRFMRVCEKVSSKLQDRMNRKPSLRKPECLDLHRLWCTGDSLFGQIGASKLIYDKRRIEITGLRLVTMTGRRLDWNEDESELSLAICIMQMIADVRVGITHNLHCVANFSHHSLGRFFQRAFRPSGDHLLSAIWSVAPKVSDMLGDRQQAEFCLPQEEAGGSWHGRIANSITNGKEDGIRPSLDIRTFFNRAGQEL